MAVYNDVLLNKAANDTAADFVRGKIAEIVKDPAKAKLLQPDSHPIGTKRICVDTGYFATFNRPNVELVDIRDNPIEAITENAVRAAGKDYEADALVLATGFDAMTGSVAKIDIVGRERQTLNGKWAEGPRTYLGLMTAGFPNLFIITGPGSPSVLSNMIVSIEQHVDWIADCLVHMQDKGLATIGRRSKPRQVGRHVNKSPTTRSTRRPTPGTWAPTFPASRASSCPTSAAFPSIVRNATRSPRTDMKALRWRQRRSGRPRRHRDFLSVVMPGLVPGIHAYNCGPQTRRWPGRARP